MVRYPSGSISGAFARSIPPYAKKKYDSWGKNLHQHEQPETITIMTTSSTAALTCFSNPYATVASTTKASNEHLEHQLAHQLDTLHKLQHAIAEAAAVCEGHATMADATLAAEREALALGAKVAALEDVLQRKEAESDRQLSICEALATEAKQLRLTLGGLRDEVSSLQRRAEAEGIVVDIRPIDEAMARHRLDEMRREEEALLLRLQMEVTALREKEGRLNLTREGNDARRQRLAALEEEEALLLQTLTPLREERFVNDEVIRQLKQQIQDLVDRL